MIWDSEIHADMPERRTSLVEMMGWIAVCYPGSGPKPLPAFIQSSARHGNKHHRLLWRNGHRALSVPTSNEDDPRQSLYSSGDLRACELCTRRHQPHRDPVPQNLALHNRTQQTRHVYVPFGDLDALGFRSLACFWLQGSLKWADECAT